MSNSNNEICNDKLKIVNGKKVRIYSLVFITDKDKKKVLLGFKKRGFGIFKYNGFGGKLASNETIEECAKREVSEECSLEVDKMEKFAICCYDFVKSDTLMEVHFFHTSSYTGTIKESEEMKPIWFNIDEVPFDKMWCDDSYWYPYFLRGDHFTGFFQFGDEKTIICQYITSLEKNAEIKPIYGTINAY